MTLTVEYLGNAPGTYGFVLGDGRLGVDALGKYVPRYAFTIGRSVLGVDRLASTAPAPAWRDITDRVASVAIIRGSDAAQVLPTPRTGSVTVQFFRGGNPLLQTGMVIGTRIRVSDSDLGTLFTGALSDITLNVTPAGEISATWTATDTVATLAQTTPAIRPAETTADRVFVWGLSDAQSVRKSNLTLAATDGKATKDKEYDRITNTIGGIWHVTVDGQPVLKAPSAGEIESIWTIPQPTIYAQPITWTSASVINRLILHNHVGETVTDYEVNVPTSAGLYGLHTADLDTCAANPADLLPLANDILARLSRPDLRLASITTERPYIGDPIGMAVDQPTPLGVTYRARVVGLDCAITIDAERAVERWRTTHYLAPRITT